MNPITRRRFLGVAATGGGLAGVGGLSAPSHRMFPRLPGAEGMAGTTAPFQRPVAPYLDDAAHVLNRLTFGPRPGDHARVSALGARGFIAEQLAPESLDDARPCDAAGISRLLTPGRPANCWSTTRGGCWTG